MSFLDLSYGSSDDEEISGVVTTWDSNIQALNSDSSSEDEQVHEEAPTEVVTPPPISFGKRLSPIRDKPPPVPIQVEEVYQPNIIIVQAPITPELKEEIIVEESEEEEEEEESDNDEGQLIIVEEKPVVIEEKKEEPELIVEDETIEAASSSVRKRTVVDHRFIMSHHVRNQLQSREDNSALLPVSAEIVFYCVPINWYSKAVRSWPYNLWPKYTFIRFTTRDDGTETPFMYCMNHRNGSSYFGHMTGIPPGMEEYSFKLPINTVKLYELYEYCIKSGVKYKYDWIQEYISAAPMGKYAIWLWRTCTFYDHAETDWITSHELVYLALWEVLFKGSAFEVDEHVQSMSCFFEFINHWRTHVEEQV